MSAARRHFGDEFVAGEGEDEVAGIVLPDESSVASKK
jgi:hypothetical protein